MVFRIWDFGLVVTSFSCVSCISWLALELNQPESVLAIGPNHEIHETHEKKLTCKHEAILNESAIFLETAAPDDVV